MKITIFILVALGSFLEAVPEEAVNVLSALKGRTYFAPKEILSTSGSSSVQTSRKSVRTLSKKYISSSHSSQSSQSSQSSESSDFPSDSSFDLCSSSNSISEEPVCRLTRPIPVPRVDFQRPWCPGQVMASLIPRAMDPIYDWKNPLTCAQFASNFGGVSVLVGDLGGTDFCSAGPSLVYSNYTITRSMSINEPIYARILFNDVEYAAAAGPILYPQGLVLYISVAKEVSKLPQVCN